MKVNMDKIRQYEGRRVIYNKIKTSDNVKKIFNWKVSEIIVKTKKKRTFLGTFRGITYQHLMCK